MQDWMEKAMMVCLLAGAILWLLLVERPKEEQKKKNRQMMADYPEIVFKVAMLCQAGLSLPQVWLRVTAEYETDRPEKGVRWAYEEMAVTARQIRNGASPGRAFGDFGRRIGLHSYVKLGNLLEQNIRKGTGRLGELLQAEVYQALEEQRHQIRRSGEETGTKLLIPMFLMFGVVIVMILVPAFEAFTL